MKKNLEKFLIEMFGMPIGAYAGKSMVGVRNERDDHLDEMGDICPDCDMMTVDGQCGFGDKDDSIMNEPLKLAIVEPVQLDPITITIDLEGSMDSEKHGNEKPCPNCGMMAMDELGLSCGCGHNEHSEETCGGCGKPASMCKCDEAGTCDVCGVMLTIEDEPTCSCGMNGDGCGKMDEKSCSECGMAESVCECGYMNEAKKRKKEGPSKKTASKISKDLGKKMSTKAEKIAKWPGVRDEWSMAQWFKQQEK